MKCCIEGSWSLSLRCLKIAGLLQALPPVLKQEVMANYHQKTGEQKEQRKAFQHLKSQFHSFPIRPLRTGIARPLSPPGSCLFYPVKFQKENMLVCHLE